MIFRGEDTVLIDIEAPETVKQPSGDIATTWQVYHKAYANKRFRRGNERFQSVQKEASEVIEWKIRFTSGITQLMRIKQGGDFYDIQTIDNKQRDGFMVIVTQGYPNREQSNRIGAGQ